jgi:hypothetical protein
MNLRVARRAWPRALVPSTLACATGLLVVPAARSAGGVPDPALLAARVSFQEEAHAWEWRVAPYLWAAAIDGELTTENADVELEVDFGDIWDNLDSAGLVFVEARKDRLSLLGDIVYLGLELDGNTPGGADVDADVDTTIVELAGLFRVSPTSPFEVGLGLRYASMDTEFEVGMASADSDRDSIDGFVAGRAVWPFAERWSASLYGDVGAGDADLTWQLSALLGVHFDGWGLSAGYRALDYDFDEGSASSAAGAALARLSLRRSRTRRPAGTRPAAPRRAWAIRSGARARRGRRPRRRPGRARGARARTRCAPRRRRGCRGRPARR